MSGQPKKTAGHVGDQIKAQNARWTFSGSVAESFDQHVEKSVPLYHEGHTLTTHLSDFFLEKKSTCYELGCSTGELTRQLAEHNDGKDIRFVGYDVEELMIKKAQEKCQNFKNVTFMQADIMDIEFEPCDLVVAYLTIQFVRPKNRQVLIDRIYNALNWGGAFIMVEKVRGPDARFQDISSQLYNEYKISQGYDAEEILSKSRSLKGVMEPFSTQGNVDLLNRSGFKDITTFFKYICFEGFLAIK